MIKSIVSGPVLQVFDVAAAGQWLCENLFFRPVNSAENSRMILENGSCTLYLEPCRKFISSPPPENSYFTGLAHVALRTGNIEAALEWCKTRSLVMQLQEGRSFFNPGVFGGGELYYNILSPFGVVFEISQRVSDREFAGPQIIYGLDHLGIPCADLDAELDFLEGIGFVAEFPIVHNFNDREGNILCDMVSRQGLTLEVYQFVDRTPCSMPQDSPLRGVYGLGTATCSPGGLQMFE